MSDKAYKTFIDNAGRNIFGAVASETDTELTIENPVVIMVQQQQNGQMAVQLFPLFFPEFIVPNETSDRDTNFTFAKASIALGGSFSVDPRIIDQYDKIVHPVLQDVAAPVAQEEPETIKLFDEEEK